jgi:hypothetical protein
MRAPHLPELQGAVMEILDCRITEDHLERARLILGRTDNPIFLAQLLANFDGCITLAKAAQQPTASEQPAAEDKYEHVCDWCGQAYTGRQHQCAPNEQEMGGARAAAERLLNEVAIHRDLDPSCTGQFAKDIEVVSRQILALETESERRPAPREQEMSGVRTGLLRQNQALRAAAERLLALIWESNFERETESEWERAVVALRTALASVTGTDSVAGRAPVNTPGVGSTDSAPETKALREALDPESFAVHVLHHIDEMYPSMWDSVPKSARTSIRNTIINRLRAALAQPSESAEVAPGLGIEVAIRALEIAEVGCSVHHREPQKCKACRAWDYVRSQRAAPQQHQEER